MAVDRKLMGTSVKKFDFSKYRSRDIVEKLAEILNIRGAFMNVLRTGGLLEVGLFIVFIVSCVLFADLAFLELVFFSIYLLLIGIVLGVLLGLIRVVHRSLSNIEGVLTILLDASKQAALDFAEMRSGTVQIPSGKEIVTGMYEQVIMPSVEEVVSEAFGFLGKPILWMYRKTIGAAVGRLLIAAHVKEHSIGDERLTVEDLGDERVDEAVEEIAKETRPALEYIESAKSVVASIGGGLRSFAIRPLYIIFTFVLLLALTPIIAYIAIFGMPT